MTRWIGGALAALLALGSPAFGLSLTMEPDGSVGSGGFGLDPFTGEPDANPITEASAWIGVGFGGGRLGDVALPTTLDVGFAQSGGSLTYTLTNGGAEALSLFFAFYVDPSFLGGDAVEQRGARAAGQSFEAEDRLGVFPDLHPDDGASVSSLEIGILSNTVEEPFDTFFADYHAAIGFDFSLGAGEVATLAYTLSELDPGAAPSDLTLVLYDPSQLSADTLAFSGTLAIQPADGGPPTGLPEPAGLLAVALLLAAARRR